MCRLSLHRKKIKNRFVKSIYIKAEQLREKLHQYIDKLDETRLDEVYKIIEEKDIPRQYSPDIKMFYKRRSSYLRREGKNYTKEESINSLRK
jgi:hypothetical protein